MGRQIDTNSGHVRCRVSERLRYRREGGGDRERQRPEVGRRSVEGERKEGGSDPTHSLLQGPPEEDEDYPRDHEGKGCAQ